MATTNVIDLSTLPAPAVVEALSYEAILAAMLADLIARDSAFTALVESDPAFKILEVAAFREFLLRQRVNDGARQVLLAYAVGTNLDQLAALFGVARNLITPANTSAIPPVAAVWETDSSLRRRVQLSLDSLSVAGPENAYIFHALSVPSIKDASASSPTAGAVLVTILNRTGNGSPTAQDISDVSAALNSDDVRPLTDNVTVQGASIQNYTVTATVYTQSGVDPAVVFDASLAALDAYTVSQHSIGRDVTMSGLYAALHQPGVHHVTISSPSSDVTCTDTQAPFCMSKSVTNGGVVA
jgi:phage-related baseplate assembly protein